MKYCQKCGNQLSAEGICSRCGNNFIEPHTDNEQYRETDRIRCPICGGTDLHIATETNIHTDEKSYSLGLGCLGFILWGVAGLAGMLIVGPLILFFAPLGLLCGLCGGRQKTYSENTVYWICKHCGNKFSNYNAMNTEHEQTNKSLFEVLVMIGAGIFLVVVLFMVVLPTVISIFSK